MKTHKPIYTKAKDGKVLYHKIENNDDFLHRKTWAISINAENLEKTDYVRVTLNHRCVDLWQTKQAIKTSATVLTFKSAQTGKSETKYYLPLDLWNVASGNKNWYEDIDARIR